VADVIISLAPVLPRFLGEHTTLICSGILDSRLGDVTAALERAGLSILNTRAKEEWRCLEVTKQR
jgi:ribosomal protein L11 methyltransferase